MQSEKTFAVFKKIRRKHEASFALFFTVTRDDFKSLELQAGRHHLVIAMRARFFALIFGTSFFYVVRHGVDANGPKTNECDLRRCRLKMKQVEKPKAGAQKRSNPKPECQSKNSKEISDCLIGKRRFLFGSQTTRFNVLLYAPQHAPPFFLPFGFDTNFWLMHLIEPGHRKTMRHIHNKALCASEQFVTTDEAPAMSERKSAKPVREIKRLSIVSP